MHGARDSEATDKTTRGDSDADDGYGEDGAEGPTGNGEGAVVQGGDTGRACTVCGRPALRLGDGPPTDGSEANAYWVRRVTFSWVGVVVASAYRAQLRYADLLWLPGQWSARALWQDFARALGGEEARIRNDAVKGLRGGSRRADDFSLVRILTKQFGWRYYPLGLLKFAADCVGFASPMLLNGLISFLDAHTAETSQHADLTTGFLYAIGLVLCSFVGAVLNSQYNYRVRCVGVGIRGALISGRFPA